MTAVARETAAKAAMPTTGFTRASLVPGEIAVAGFIPGSGADVEPGAEPDHRVDAGAQQDPRRHDDAEPQLGTDQRADEHLPGVGLLGGLTRVDGRAAGGDAAATAAGCLKAARRGDPDPSHACGRIRVASSFSRTDGRCRRLIGSSAPATVTLGRAAASFMWLRWLRAIR